MTTKGLKIGHRIIVIKARQLNLLEILDQRELQIIKYREGNSEVAPKTYKEIGIIFGISASRVMKIENKALRKLAMPLWKEGVDFSDLGKWLKGESDNAQKYGFYGLEKWESEPVLFQTQEPVII